MFTRPPRSLSSFSRPVHRVESQRDPVGAGKDFRGPPNVVESLVVPVWTDTLSVPSWSVGPLFPHFTVGVLGREPRGPSRDTRDTISTPGLGPYLTRGTLLPVLDRHPPTLNIDVVLSTKKTTEEEHKNGES